MVADNVTALAFEYRRSDMTPLSLSQLMDGPFVGGGSAALGVQESAASPAGALAKALAAREEKRAALATEAEIRAQIEQRGGSACRLVAGTR